MSHMCDRALSEKIKGFKIFNKKSKTDQRCCSAKRFNAHSKYSKHYNEADERNKMKRLKTCKERSRIKGGWKENSKIKSHKRHCLCQSNVDMAYLHNCCHACCHSSKRKPPFPRVVPSAQEPCIITDSRLTRHHGLFNHEVKSVDTERLLSEQQNLEENEQIKEKRTDISHLYSTSHSSTPLSSDGLLGADTDVMSFRKKADPASKDHTDCQEKEKKNLQFDTQQSDVTPGQRPQQRLALSCESFQSSHLSKHSFLNVVTTKTKKACAMSENNRESLLTPIVDGDDMKTLNANVKKHVISTPEQNPEIQEPPVQQIQSHGLSASPFKLFSSPTTDSCHIQDRRQDPEYVTKSVRAVAARLCDRLKLPLMRSRNLLSENREVLLNALQERHGPWLQENLLRVQQHLSFAVHPRNKVQDHDQEPARINEEEQFPADMPVKMSGSRHFKWKPSPYPHCRQKQAAEWLTSPMETSVSIFDNIFRPSLSPQLYIDLGPCGDSESKREKASVPEDWEEHFNRSKSKKSPMFDSFENCFMDYTRATGQRSPGYFDINTQLSFSYQEQLPDRHAGEPMYFAQQEDLLGTDRYSCAPSFPAQIHHQSNHFQPLSHFSQPSACPHLKSHNTDMMYYPPSYMLERDPAQSLAAFPSPESWSFPPMRLY
ncbi:proline-rich protein 19 [Archocentrus centrarchus]|uniref:proline-rich protein 19 n=1 Tax=Archocentrus centrarchus TaxID=63155 RepID=UPI0011E9DFEF|nr:uncharacterized protein LOC115794764 [Archocentrus centrarchus]